jgi:prevent-host-death family protein
LEDAMDGWTVAQAKAKLSEVIERALSGAPQTITRNGRIAVVVVAADEWRRRTERKGTLAGFLMAAPVPLSEAGIGPAADGDRIKGGLRDADLG